MRRHRLIIAYALLAGGSLAALAFWQRARPAGIGFWVTALLAFALVGIELLEQAEPAALPAPAPTPPVVDQPVPVARGASPYRGRLRRALTGTAPPLSGVTLSLLVGGSLAASAVIVPLLSSLSPWREAQIVLLVWWLVSFAVLAGVLFRGARFSDDAGRAGWPWSGPLGEPGPAPGAPRDRGGRLLEPVGCLDDLGTIAVVAVALAGAAWIVVELLLPLVFLMLYRLTRSALAHVMNDAHECRGRIGRAALWGAFWATLYIAPPALLVWGAELVGRR